MTNASPMLFASLPMYDFAEIVTHTDALWDAIARELTRRGVASVPLALARPSGSLHEHWLDQALLLSHTCGLPLVRVLTQAQHVLGSFAVASGSPDRPGSYRTVIVCRADDPRGTSAGFDGTGGLARFAGAPVAVNDAGSLSGWVSLGVALADAGVRPGPITFTGAHATSVDAVQRGVADLASIDAHSFALFAAHRPAAVAGLRVIGHGPEVAMTPLITARADLVPVLREAIGAALDAIAPTTRWALQIVGFVEGGREMHAQVPELAEKAMTVMPCSGDDPQPVGR